MDDNVIYTDTMIKTKNGSVTTKQFANNPKHRRNLPLDAFKHFKVESCMRCKIKRAKYYDKFIECMTNNKHICVITARSHPNKGLKIIIKRILQKVKLPLYFNNRVKLYCVNNKHFSNIINKFMKKKRWPIKTANAAKQLRDDIKKNRIDTCIKKRIALLDFTTMHPNAVTIGFSDDDNNNLNEMKKTLSLINMKTRVYN